MLALRILAAELGALVAPLVTLFYRDGWFNTPDDPVSPRGMGEPFMRRLHAKIGPWWADWWWLGWRNRAYGLAYALKPAHFKTLSSYEICRLERRLHGPLRITRVDGFPEFALDCRWFHVLAGYRVTPIYNEVIDNARRRDERWPLIPFRPLNMDARPIFSIRSGTPD
jgi:hypothetical protein